MAIQRATGVLDANLSGADEMDMAPSIKEMFAAVIRRPGVDHG